MSRFKSLFRQRIPTRHYRDRRRSDFRPDRDWRFLFGSFLILAIIIFVGAVSLYRVLDSLEVISQQRMTATGTVRLDEIALSRVVTALDEKKNQFEILLTTPIIIVDPSR
ncbi:MAG TPA: hypothetical protein VJB69_01135 [Candidatus Paceibacterota bacterium]